MSTVAVILARGGSKGIPGKNVAVVAGAPLVEHSVVQAVRSSSVDEVYVSTDDAAIAAVARRAGATIIDRPADIAGDTATSESALEHALEHISGTVGDPELVVFLQPTSPLRRPTDIDDAVRTLRSSGADSLFSANELHAFLWREAAGEVTSFSYDHRSRPRRQDREVTDWIENGSIYVFRPWVLREHGNRLGGRIAVHEMSASTSFQIDEPGDIELIEAIAATEPGVLTGLSVPALTLRDLDLLVFDFDGVFTDNTVVVDQHGTESVVCDRSDGMGVSMLRQAGLDMAILSTETNPVVAARAAKLSLEVHQGSSDKAADLQALVAARDADLGRVAFVGNDVNDLPALDLVGVPIAVADAVPDVLKVARWVTSRPGGRGAVREIADQLLG